MAENKQEDKKPDGETLFAGGKVMSVFEHLDELRTRLVRSMWSIGIIFCVAFYFSNQIFEFLKVPLLDALPAGTTSRQALHFTDPMDVFMMSMKVAFLGSLVFGSPFWLYQFWKFFEPALYPRERRYVLPFITFSVLFFMIGMAFCYYAMLPLTLKYLIGVGLEVGTPMITITDYMSLVTVLFLGSGAVFETPLILVLLSLLGVIDSKTLSEHRKVTIVIILIAAAIITPSPDPLSQLILAAPMYVMYEGSVLVIRLLEKNRTTTAS